MLYSSYVWKCIVNVSNGCSVLVQNYSSLCNEITASTSILGLHSEFQARRDLLKDFSQKTKQLPIR